MIKILIFYAILTAFIIDSSMKSVCAYNDKLKNQKLISIYYEYNHLGKISLRWDESLNCSNKDKPFVYKKQIDQSLILTNKIYKELFN